MRQRFLKLICETVLAILMVAGGMQIVSAQSESPERSIEGVWRVTFTPHNCVTGDPIPAAVFEALFSFHKDGTMSVWSQNNVITVTRTPGHGLWQREQGWNEYSTKFILLQYNLTTGAFSARQEARGTLVLGESGNEYTASSSTTVFFANGNPPVTGCSTSVGTRFE
jgi:hypothetical protein